MITFDLAQPSFSYLFGFIQTDGHLQQNTRNRGRLSIEISERDIDILYKFQNLILPIYSSISTRTRNTNFKNNYSSSIWTVFDLTFRTLINNLGIPYGKKSNLISIPQISFSEIDYFRGIIDGDGSLGFAKGIPFLSLVTASKNLANEYEIFISKLIHKHKKLTPNKRDGIYNICIFSEDAQIVIKKLYYKDCLCLDRKYKLANEVLLWKRPLTMRKNLLPKKIWTKEEDKIISTFPIEVASKELNRTHSSIKTRLYRLSLL